MGELERKLQAANKARVKALKEGSVMTNGMYRLAAATTAILAALADPAAAQQGTSGGSTSAETGITWGTQEGQSESRTLTRERGVESSVTISAAQVILPALTAGAELSFAVPRGTQLPNGQYLDCLVAAADGANLDYLRHTTAEFRKAHTLIEDIPEDWRRDPKFYSLGNVYIFPPAGGGAAPRILEVVGREGETVLMAELRLDATADPWDYLSDKGIIRLEPEPYKPKIASVLPVGQTDRLPRALTAENIYWYTTARPEEAAFRCIGILAARHVTADVLGWMTDDHASEARADTIANIVVLELARRIAAQMQAVSYRHPDVARDLAQLYARELASEAVAKWYALTKLQDIRITLNYTDCGHGWTAALPTGENFAFCGSATGYQISQAANPWGGAGWLAGSLPLIVYAETGVASMQEAVEAVASSDMSWSQRLRAILGIGN